MPILTNRRSRSIDDSRLGAVPRRVRARSACAVTLLVAGLALAATPALAERRGGGSDAIDDPAIARRLDEARASWQPSYQPWFHFSLGAGYASPLADPDLHEGWGAAIGLAVGQRWGGELRGSFSWQHYVDELDFLGLDFITGDITPGIFYHLTRPSPDQVLAVRLSGGFGPYWMAGIGGITWSLGVRAGIGLEWRIARALGLRLDANYHVFHLTEIGGATFYDRRSLGKVGAIDRFELPLSLVVHL